MEFLYKNLNKFNEYAYFVNYKLKRVQIKNK